jgi:type II secretory pathway predicted ATPase ExeA
VYVLDFFGLSKQPYKLLQILLVGQPELNKKLSDHRMRQLQQRITTHADLEAFDMVEMMWYINHRICVANGGGKVFFDPKAYQDIFKATKGYPRLVNLVCHRALMATYVREAAIVDRVAVKQAIADWKGSKPRSTWGWLKRLVYS